MLQIHMTFTLLQRTCKKHYWLFYPLRLNFFSQVWSNRFMLPLQGRHLAILIFPSSFSYSIRKRNKGFGFLFFIFFWSIWFQTVGWVLLSLLSFERLLQSSAVFGCRQAHVQKSSVARSLKGSLVLCKEWLLGIIPSSYCELDNKVESAPWNFLRATWSYAQALSSLFVVFGKVPRASLQTTVIGYQTLEDKLPDKIQSL